MPSAGRRAPGRRQGRQPGRARPGGPARAPRIRDHRRRLPRGHGPGRRAPAARRPGGQGRSRRRRATSSAAHSELAKAVRARPASPPDLADAIRRGLRRAGRRRRWWRFGPRPPARTAGTTSFAGMNRPSPTSSGPTSCWHGSSTAGPRCTRPGCWPTGGCRGITTEPSIAVVVQAMVDVVAVRASCSASTPRCTDGSQLVIEAALGLGEVVVSGQVEPDTYVVRPRRPHAWSPPPRPASTSRSSAATTAATERVDLPAAQLGLQVINADRDPGPGRAGPAGRGATTAAPRTSSGPSTARATIWLVQSRPITAVGRRRRRRRAPPTSRPPTRRRADRAGSGSGRRPGSGHRAGADPARPVRGRSPPGRRRAGGAHDHAGLGAHPAPRRGAGHRAGRADLPRRHREPRDGLAGRRRGPRGHRAAARRRAGDRRRRPGRGDHAPPPRPAAARVDLAAASRPGPPRRRRPATVSEPEALGTKVYVNLAFPERARRRGPACRSTGSACCGPSSC